MTSKRLLRRSFWAFAAVTATTVGLVAPASAGAAAAVSRNGPVFYGFGYAVWGIGAGLGSTEVELDVPGSNGGEPAIAPDGSRIAMTGVPSNPSAWGGEVFVRTLDGTSTREVTFANTFGDGHASTTSASWAPDSRHLTVVHGDSVWTVDSKSRAVRRVTFAPKGFEDASPRWSPDGREIVFVRQDVTETYSDLYLVKPDGSGLHRLTTTSNGAALYPDWSPDGKRILFVRNTYTKAYHFPGFASQLMTVTRDGASVRALTTVGQSNYFRWPTWSPDGKQFVVGRIAPYPYGNDIGYSLAIYDAGGHFLHWLRGAANQDLDDNYWSGVDWAPLSVAARLPKG